MSKIIHGAAEHIRRTKEQILEHDESAVLLDAILELRHANQHAHKAVWATAARLSGIDFYNAAQAYNVLMQGTLVSLLSPEDLVFPTVRGRAYVLRFGTAAICAVPEHLEELAHRIACLLSEKNGSEPPERAANTGILRFTAFEKRMSGLLESLKTLCPTDLKLDATASIALRQTGLSIYASGTVKPGDRQIYRAYGILTFQDLTGRSELQIGHEELVKRDIWRAIADIQHIGSSSGLKPLSFPF